MKNIYLLFAIIVLLVGCGHSKVVVAPEKLTEVQHDSIFVYVESKDFDSTYVSHTERSQGDTILIRDTLIRFKTLYLDRMEERATEKSVEIEKPYAVEVVKEVRKRNWYDRMTSRGFWIFVLSLAVYIYLRIRR